jgi:hypothetical protein
MANRCEWEKLQYSAMKHDVKLGFRIHLDGAQWSNDECHAIVEDKQDSQVFLNGWGIYYDGYRTNVRTEEKNNIYFIHGCRKRINRVYT